MGTLWVLFTKLDMVASLWQYKGG